MNLFTDNNSSVLISKGDRILIFLMFFSCFFFYGLLNLNFFLKIPTSLPSGLMRLTTFLIAGYFIFKDFSHGEYPKMTTSIISLAVFFLYYFFIFLIDENAFSSNLSFSGGGSIQKSKLDVIYLFFLSAPSYFFMFFAGRRRMEYILNNPQLVYIPSLLSVLIIIFTNVSVFETFDLYQTYLYDYGDVRRAAIIAPVMNLMMVSPFLMFFSKNKLCNFFWGPLGCVVGLSCALISDSRSAIVTISIILLFYAIVSIRHIYSTVYALVVYIFGAIVFIPYLMFSKAFDRVMKLEKILDYNLVSDDQLSRIDLIKSGFSQFLDNPVFGGHIYLIGGGYSHCTPVSILYSTGIIGMLLILVVCGGILKGVFALNNIFREKSIWIYALAIVDVCMMLINGDTMTFFCGSFSVFLMANAFATERRW